MRTLVMSLSAFLSSLFITFVLVFPVQAKGGAETIEDPSTAPHNGEVLAGVGSVSARDPFEPWNRAVFIFNDKLDTYLLRPTAQGYHFLMPDFAERGVTNVFANLYDATTVVNAVLQGRLTNAGRSGGRFLVNSTLGVLGLFDVASRMGLMPYNTDFGHTLAVWGVPEGPYLMVPVLGPRTVRSGTGTIVNAYMAPQTYIDNVRLRNSLYGTELVNTRARLLEAEELMSGDRYIFVRDAYLQQRKMLVNDGQVSDSFSDFGDSDDWEDTF
ncbi:MAG: VacJ family lipoprotein [Parahaliea sp.]